MRDDSMENRDLAFIAVIFIACLGIVGYLVLTSGSNDNGVNEVVDKYTKVDSNNVKINTTVNDSKSNKKVLANIAVKYKDKLDKAVNYLNNNYKNLVGSEVKFRLKDIDDTKGYVVLYLNASVENQSGEVIALLSKTNNTLLIGQIARTDKVFGNVSGSNVDEKVRNFVKLLDLKQKERIKSANISITLENYTIKNDMIVIQLNIEFNGKIEKDYMMLTQDGKYVLLRVLPLDITKKIEPPKPPEPPKQKPIPKTDKPKVEVFVMSYCPFGVQMERAILPVINLFKDKVDFEIKFVDYAMHGENEVNENLRQYCIQKINKEEYWKYLKCFIKTGNYSLCLNNVSINLNELNKCINETDAKYNISYYRDNKSTYISGVFPKFLVEENDNQKYGVQGSPTTFINGVEYVGLRAPNAIKETICNAFTNQPEECNVELSKDVVSYGIGEVGQGSGSCG